MNISRFLSIAFIALCGPILAGCSNLQSLNERPSDREVKASTGASIALSEITLEEGDSLFKISRDGTIVPVTEGGKTYARCVDEEDQSGLPVCRIFRGDITVTDLDQFSIVRLRYTGSPQCQMWSYYNKARDRREYVFNPNDPNCADHHR